jgi:hypothetical protein
MSERLGTFRLSVAFKIQSGLCPKLFLASHSERLRTKLELHASAVLTCSGEAAGRQLNSRMGLLASAIISLGSHIKFSKPAMHATRPSPQKQSSSFLAFPPAQCSQAPSVRASPITAFSDTLSLCDANHRVLRHPQSVPRQSPRYQTTLVCVTPITAFSGTLSLCDANHRVLRHPKSV